SAVDRLRDWEKRGCILRRTAATDAKHALGVVLLVQTPYDVGGEAGVRRTRFGPPYLIAQEADRANCCRSEARSLREVCNPIHSTKLPHWRGRHGTVP